MSLFKIAKRLPMLEVYPQHTFPTEEPVPIWHVRIKAQNGHILFYSGTEGYDKDRAIRAAKQFNERVALGQLKIRVLDADGNCTREIPPRWSDK